MHLADAAEVRVLQQVAANSKLATPFAERHRMSDKTTGKRSKIKFYVVFLYKLYTKLNIFV
jgi:hypothetical protein